MAVNYSDLTRVTIGTWMNVGGTFALNGKALTNGSIRQGDKSTTLLSVSMGFPELLEVTLETKLQSAPTAGNLFTLYLGFSSSATAGTDNPAGLGGADASGPNTDTLTMLTMVGSIILSNNIGTGIQRQDKMLVLPKDLYVIPVIDNESGQTTTNVDGDTKVTIVALYRRTPIG